MVSWMVMLTGGSVRDAVRVEQKQQQCQFNRHSFYYYYNNRLLLLFKNRMQSNPRTSSQLMRRLLQVSNSIILLSKRNNLIMQIKLFEKHKPEDNLKLISISEQFENTQPHNYFSPEKRREKIWVMDAWEENIENPSESPERRKYSRKVVHNYSSKVVQGRSHKSVRKDCKQDKQNQWTSKCPLTMDLPKPSENQAKWSSRLHSQRRHSRLPSIDPEEIALAQQSNHSKAPLTSILYPVLKNQVKSKFKRFERFHSFVARSVRTKNQNIL